MVKLKAFLAFRNFIGNCNVAHSSAHDASKSCYTELNYLGFIRFVLLKEKVAFPSSTCRKVRLFNHSLSTRSELNHTRPRRW